METSPGTRLRYLRELLGFKGQQQEFADAVGLTQQSISNMERDKTEPAAKSLNKIYAAFPQVNIGWLVSGVGKPLDTAPAQQSPQPKAPGVPSYAEEAEPLSISRLTPAEVAAMQAELVATKRALETANQTIERLWDQNTVLIKKPEASADAADLRTTVDEIAAEHQARMQLVERPDIARFDIRPRPQMRAEVGGLRRWA